MSATPNILGLFLGTGAALLVLNEVRGLVLAAPVLYGIYQAGGSLAAIWIGICSLTGIALSVLLPLIAVRKLHGVKRRRLSRNSR